MNWNYKIHNLNAHFSTGGGCERKIQEICDEYGKDGWELVSCQCYDLSSKFMLAFKKPAE